MSIIGLSAASGSSYAAEKVFRFLNWHLFSRRGRSLLSTFIHNRLHDNVQTSQCIHLNPFYLFSRKQLTFLRANRTKQSTPITVLNRGAQPILAFPSFFFSQTSRQEACMLNIRAAHETRDLFISLNRLSGPRQDQEPKGQEPCDSPSTAPQRLNPQPQPRMLPLALAKAKRPK
ncbi:hypothetical protein ACFX2H_003173 [Malus domestica]